MRLGTPEKIMKERPAVGIKAEDVTRVARLLRRYCGATPEGLEAVLCPLLIPIATLDKTIIKLKGQTHYRASFSMKITRENESVLQIGRTGKFVPGRYLDGGAWLEVAKGRIIKLDENAGVALGEVYTGGTRTDLEAALKNLTQDDLLEIDQYGAAAKVLSGLAEYELCVLAQAQGYKVRRMPEDMARHLGSYANYDFEFEKGGRVQKVEVKSLWGTDTRRARLIHSTTTAPKGEQKDWTEEQRRNFYPTSSCKFTTQDIFAVSLFLRTGNIKDFAFARSVPKDKKKPFGLPRASDYPEHVNQNPSLDIGDGTWFATIDEVWNLDKEALTTGKSVLEDSSLVPPLKEVLKEGAKG
jgi:hypothetical protein